MTNRSLERIQERTDTARFQMEQQGPVQRAVSRTGLDVANTMDKVTATADDDRLWFLGGTATGALTGAVWGALAAATIIAVFPLASALWVGAICVGLGTAGFAIHDGQTVLEEHQNAHGKSLSDVVARDLGATPKEPKLQLTDNAEETLALSGRSVIREDREALAALDRAGMNQHPSYVAREDQRRAAAASSSTAIGL